GFAFEQQRPLQLQCEVDRCGQSSIGNIVLPFEQGLEFVDRGWNHCLRLRPLNSRGLSELRRVNPRNSRNPRLVLISDPLACLGQCALHPDRRYSFPISCGSKNIAEDFRAKIASNLICGLRNYVCRERLPDESFL